MNIVRHSAIEDCALKIEERIEQLELFLRGDHTYVSHVTVDQWSFEKDRLTEMAKTIRSLQDSPVVAYVIMTNDYPAAICGSEEMAGAEIINQKNIQRERYRSVESNSEQIEERLKTYHVRAYDFVVKT